MPRKVLGSDPFARSEGVKKPGAKTQEAEADAREESGESLTGLGANKPSLKRVKLIEPSAGPPEAAGEEEREEKTVTQARRPDEKPGKSSKRPKKAAKQKRSPAERPAQRKKKERPAAGEYATPEEESTTESTSTLSSDERGEPGLLGRLFETASPHKVGRLFGELRLRGRSDDVDEFGKDPVYTERVEPLFEWLYEKYWRVEAEGVENVPDEGAALLVANHSGMLPFDGIMIGEAVKLEGPTERDVRFLVEDMFGTLPFLAPFLARIGAARASRQNAERLLQQGNLVCVFPEGEKGTGKPFAERYQLQRFGRGGFVKLCMLTKAPLVPVAVVGAEEIYPIIARFERLGKPFGLPYVPVTPAWPLLGPLGLIPLPSKWRIRFGKPVRFEKYGKQAAKDEILVSRIREDVRDKIQDMLDDMLKKRKSAWFG